MTTWKKNAKGEWYQVSLAAQPRVGADQQPIDPDPGRGVEVLMKSPTTCFTVWVDGEMMDIHGRFASEHAPKSYAKSVAALKTNRLTKGVSYVLDHDGNWLPHKSGVLCLRDWDGPLEADIAAAKDHTTIDELRAREGRGPIASVTDQLHRLMTERSAVGGAPLACVAGPDYVPPYILERRRRAYRPPRVGVDLDWD